MEQSRHHLIEADVELQIHHQIQVVEVVAQILQPLRVVEAEEPGTDCCCWVAVVGVEGSSWCLQLVLQEEVVVLVGVHNKQLAKL